MIDLNQVGPRIIITFGDSGKIFLTESTCYAMIVAVILGALGIWLGSNLKEVPKGKQVLAEVIVGFVYNFAEENMGKKDGDIYAPYLGSLIMYLIFANSLGLIGIRPITADIDVTAGLAIVSFLIIQVASVHRLGFKRRLDEMCDPFVFMLPMEIISNIVLPVTLALRLFGNIFGGMIVVDMWLDLMGKLSLKFCSVPILRLFTGIPLNLFFDIFEPLIQAYIFAVLTAINLKQALAGPNPETMERKRRQKKLERLERAK